MYRRSLDCLEKCKQDPNFKKFLDVSYSNLLLHLYCFTNDICVIDNVYIHVYIYYIYIIYIYISEFLISFEARAKLAECVQYWEYILSQLTKI